MTRQHWHHLAVVTGKSHRSTRKGIGSFRGRKIEWADMFLLSTVFCPSWRGMQDDSTALSIAVKKGRREVVILLFAASVYNKVSWIAPSHMLNVDSV